MARRSKNGHFQVWNEGSDSYKHTDLAYNWDNLDRMIGSSSSNDLYGIGDDFNNPTTTAPTTNMWLYPQDTTVIANFGNRTLYNIVRALDFNSPPLGEVTAWWRPSVAVPLPSGWVPCDGSSYTGTDKHSYGAWGITTVTVPDLRNRMVLGAYETATGSSATALNRDGTAASSTDTATNGPGIRAAGGTNVPRNLAHTHTAGSFVTADHLHNLTDHVHLYLTYNHTHTFGGSTGAPSNNTLFTQGTAGGLIGRPDQNHTHSFGPINSGGMDGGAPVTTTYGMPGPVATGAADRPLTVSGTSASSLTSTDMMPLYYGLMYIVKIRKAAPLHSTVFAVGP